MQTQVTFPQIAFIGPMTAARASFADVFRDHAAFVWRSLGHMGVRPADLEDQSQEVFIVVHRRQADWNGEHVRAWLYAICRRVAAAYRRRRYRVHERTVDTMPEVATEPRDLRDLRLALATLGEDERDVFVLHEIEQFVLREVCEMLDSPMHTVYRRLQTAREKILKHLTKGNP